MQLVKLLQKIGVENAEEIAQKLASNEDAADVIDLVLAASQTYAKPFLESEFNQKTSEERKTWKGKYFKELTLKFNKQFGGLLTNSEIDDILADPQNEGKTFDAVLAELHKKATESMTPKELTEYKKMIDAQSQKINDYEEKMKSLESEYEKKFEDKLNQTKLDSAIDTELLSIIPKITSISPAAAAKIVRTMLNDKAAVKLVDGKISLFDPKNPDAPLKKSGTELYKFQDLVSEIAKEAELPEIKSGGSGGAGTPPPPPPDPNNTLSPAAQSAKGLAEIVAGMS